MSLRGNSKDRWGEYELFHQWAVFCMNGHLNIGDITPTKYFFSIAVVLGLLFAMTSSDHEQPAVLGFMQWQIQAVVPIALLIMGHMLLLKNSFFSKLNSWMTLLISGVFAATVFTPIALAIDHWLQPGSQTTTFNSELLNEWISVSPPIVICWIALNTPWLLGYQLKKISSPIEKTSTTPRHDESIADQARTVPEFMTLLQSDQRGQVLFLKSELHYLQVLTDQGGGLILYNLSDAISQMPTHTGMQVHRSYWVAFNAIDAFSRKGRQGEILLRNGDKIPVSRNKLGEVSQRISVLIQADEVA